MQVNSHESRSVASDGLTKCIQAMVSLNIYKNSANKFGRKTGFKIENEIEDQDQSIQKLIGILTQVFCTFGPNLVILAWTGDELSCRQAQNGVTFDFEVKFDLEGQGQSPPKTIGILTKVFYTYGPNLVILAWAGDELSRGQASDYRTHGRTDTQTDAGNDNTRRLKLAMGKKRNTKKWGHPFSWIVIGDGYSTSVYNDSKYLTSSLTEIEPHTAITNQPDEVRKKDNDRKLYKESNLK